MIDILIIAHFIQVPGEYSNNRFHYLGELIAKQPDTNVEIVTTKFSHLTKRQRVVTNEQISSLPYKLTMLPEPGYSKNVSLKRLLSHFIFSRKLRKYLYERKKPDVVYCAVPSLDAAHIAAKYAAKNDIRFIIDVQDLWPEAFMMLFHLPVLTSLLFTPIKCKADNIYKYADDIVAVSRTYVDRALLVNQKKKAGYSVFLGTDLPLFDSLSINNKREKSDDEFRLAYIGTLGHCYDLICVIDALRIVKDMGITNISFTIMGDGPLKKKFEYYASENDIGAVFTGRLNYPEMVGLLCACDAAVNPISKGASNSIINKVCDYAAASLPVLNTQECIEYRNLLDDYNAGLNCKNGDANDLAEKIIKLHKDKLLRQELARNSRKLAEEKFNRAVTYSTIINLLIKG